MQDKYSVSIKRLDRAEEAVEHVMGRAFGENAAGETWMGDVWGLLNQASGKIGTARAMLAEQSGWDGPEPESSGEALKRSTPPDFVGVSKDEAFQIGWLRAIQWLQGNG